uniref:hypothetical protein n=1 Tax=Escherichia coli TaxID=562 RepID=UPI0020360DDA|nr:hypothetical protein [Escherichia coli]
MVTGKSMNRLSVVLPYPASPVEIVVSLCLTFSVSVVFFVGAIVGWISVSYYSRITCLNESSEISEETYNERKKK